MPDPIIVVSGLPRSGTSLMMSLLKAASVPVLQDDSRPPDASNPRGYFELSAVKRTTRDPSWVANAPGHAVKVIHRLLKTLPSNHAYKVILMRRPIAEVVASQDRMLVRLGQSIDRSAEALDASRIAAVQHAQLEEAITLLERKPNFEWIPIEFHELISHPESAISRVIDFLDLPIEAVDIVRIVDPTLHRERG